MNQLERRKRKSEHDTIVSYKPRTPDSLMSSSSWCFAFGTELFKCVRNVMVVPLSILLFSCASTGPGTLPTKDSVEHTMLSEAEFNTAVKEIIAARPGPIGVTDDASSPGHSAGASRRPTASSLVSKWLDWSKRHESSFGVGSERAASYVRNVSPRLAEWAGDADDPSVAFDLFDFYALRPDLTTATGDPGSYAQDIVRRCISNNLRNPKLNDYLARYDALFGARASATLQCDLGRNLALAVTSSRSVNILLLTLRSNQNSCFQEYAKSWFQTEEGLTLVANLGPSSLRELDQILPSLFSDVELASRISVARARECLRISDSSLDARIAFLESPDPELNECLDSIARETRDELLHRGRMSFSLADLDRVIVLFPGTDSAKQSRVWRQELNSRPFVQDLYSKEDVDGLNAYISQHANSVFLPEILSQLRLIERRRALRAILSEVARHEPESKGPIYSTEEVIARAKTSVGMVRTNSGSGTCFLVSRNGMAITNRHVVEDASACRVLLNGQEFQAIVVTRSTHPRDLALIQLESDQDFDFLRVGQRSQVRDGSEIVLIGYPGGTSIGSVVSTKGIVSNRRVESEGRDMIQIDAAANPGNSGGPLLNMYGEVIGVLTQGSISGQAIGVGEDAEAGYIAIKRENMNFAEPIWSVGELMP